MTIDETLSAIGARMLEGIMLHSQLKDYFNFLGFKGYSECQKYRYYDESKHYVELCDYNIEHNNKIIIEKKINNKNIIPDDWYMFTRFDVDGNIRKNSIKAGMEKWVQWERETKLFMEQHYQNLINLNEIAAAEVVAEIVRHVDNELAVAENKLLTLTAIDFSIPDIILEQEEECRKYKKKIKEIKL